jgi:hypothetical protein
MTALMQSVAAHNRYLDYPAVNSSQVAKFLADPIKWYHEDKIQDWPRDPPTPAMEFGTNVHRMIVAGGPTEMISTIPQEFLKVNGDINGKSKAYKQWAHERPGKILLKPGAFNPYAIIWDHLQMHPTLLRWIETGRHEEMLHFEWEGIACKVECDLIIDGVIIDWKTISTLQPRKVRAEVKERHYPVRLGFYQEAYRQEHGVFPQCILVFIKNKPGYGVLPREIDADWLAESRELAFETLLRMQTYKPGPERIEVLAKEYVP